MLLLAISALIASTMCCTSNNRPVPAWPIQLLHERSDLILICAPTKITHRPDLDATLIKEEEREYFTTTRTTFLVVSVLKGKFDDKTFELDHYALTEKGLRLGNGPVLADFADNLTKEKEAGSCYSKSSFIIYLKKNQEEGYEFVTGQNDSAFSVKTIAPVERANVARYDHQ